MISVVDKVTDNGDEEDGWHLEYINPSQEETGGLFSFEKMVDLDLHSNPIAHTSSIIYAVVHVYMQLYCSTGNLYYFMSTFILLYCKRYLYFTCI